MKKLFLFLVLVFGICSVCLANPYDGAGIYGINASSSSGSSQWDDGASSAIYYNDGNVGIGTSEPATELEVDGEVLATDYLTEENGINEIIDNASWTIHTRPNAVYYNGNTYVSWVDSFGSIGISKINNTTFEKENFVLSYKLSADDHNNASILILDSGKIVCFYSKHGADDKLYWRISTNAEDISAFDSENELTTSATQITYSQPILLDNGKIFLFYRAVISGQPGWTYSVSSDNASTFAGETMITSGINLYFYMHPVAYGNKIFFGAGDYRVTPDDIFSMYYDDATESFYESDGTLISAVGDLPITDATDMTLVHNSTDPLKIYDIAVDSAGNPVIAFIEVKELGSSSVDGDYRAYWAKWNGSSWVVSSEIVEMGGQVSTGLIYDGGVSLNRADTDRIYVGVTTSEKGTQIYEYETTDNGTTWSLINSFENIDSYNVNYWPKSVFNAPIDGTVRLIWRNGYINSYNAGYNTRALAYPVKVFKNKFTFENDFSVPELKQFKSINIDISDENNNGAIYSGSSKFVLSYGHSSGDSAKPTGLNIFAGNSVGNFTAGSTATATTDASWNIGIGTNIMSKLTTGYHNIGFGYQALRDLTSGNTNFGIGSNSMRLITTGYENVGIGSGSLLSTSTGYQNTAIGLSALSAITTTALNTGIGYQAGRYIGVGTTFNSTAENSVFIGAKSRASADGETNQIVIGYEAKGIGSNTVTLGNDSITTTALKGDIGIGTTAPSQELDIIGDIELENTTSSDTGIIYKGTSRFIHNFSHPTGDTAIPTGQNTFVGVNAGNLTMGSTATSVNHASYNIGVGYESLLSNTTGAYNLSLGHQSLYSNTTGDSNSSLGRRSLYSNTIGNSNTAIGRNALYSNINGSYNTSIGQSSLFYISNSYNTALGYQSGIYIADGSSPNNSSNSIYLGADTKALADGGSNEIVIGYNATGNGSNSATLGATTITDTFLRGDVDIRGTTNHCTLTVDADATCDAGTKIGEDNSIALCMVCAAN